MVIKGLLKNTQTTCRSGNYLQMIWYQGSICSIKHTCQFLILCFTCQFLATGGVKITLIRLQSDDTWDFYSLSFKSRNISLCISKHSFKGFDENIVITSNIFFRKDMSSWLKHTTCAIMQKKRCTVDKTQSMQKSKSTWQNCQTLGANDVHRSEKQRLEHDSAIPSQFWPSPCSQLWKTHSRSFV